MRNFFLALFVICLVVVGIFTFMRQPTFPAVNTSFATVAAVQAAR